MRLEPLRWRRIRRLWLWLLLPVVRGLLSVILLPRLLPIRLLRLPRLLPRLLRLPWHLRIPRVLLPPPHRLLLVPLRRLLLIASVLATIASVLAASLVIALAITLTFAIALTLAITTAITITIVATTDEIDPPADQRLDLVRAHVPGRGHGYTAAVPSIAPKNGQPLSLRPM